MKDLSAKSPSTSAGEGSQPQKTRSGPRTIGSRGRLWKATLVGLTLFLSSLTTTCSMQGCCPKPDRIVVVGKSEIKRIATGELKGYYAVPAARMQRLMERCQKCSVMLRQCSEGR